MASGPRVLPGRDTEKACQRIVADAAKTFGWARYFTHRSDFSPAGFPDEFLVRPPRIVAAELKSVHAYRTTNHGCSEHQLRWLALLSECPGIEVFVWTAADADTIVRTLR